MHIDSNAHTASFSALQIACRRASEQAMRERFFEEMQKRGVTR